MKTLWEDSDIDGGKYARQPKEHPVMIVSRGDGKSYGIVANTGWLMHLGSATTVAEILTKGNYQPCDAKTPARSASAWIRWPSTPPPGPWRATRSWMPRACPCWRHPTTTLAPGRRSDAAPGPRKPAA